MQNQPVQIEKYSAIVWTNEMMDELRKRECLCLNCDSMKPGPDNCSIANSLYQISKDKNVAMAITRCPVWKPKL